MKPATRIALCTAAAFSLSGCQSFVSALGFGPKNKDVSLAEGGSSVFGQDELEQGRTALKAGYPANAIKFFRLAAMNEEVAPEAFNGLGVAYAKLGRADLAERYFKMAVTLDGSNPKFAANLNRFYNSALGNSQRALAMREQAAEAELASAAKAAEAQGLLADSVAGDERRGVLTLVNPAVRMSRTSGREIRLSTSTGAGPATGNMPSVAVRNPTKAPEPKAEMVDEASSSDVGDEPAEVTRKAPKQISMIGGPAIGEGYPVRISLTKPQSGKAAPARQGNYPLRVALAPKQGSN